MKLMRHSWKHDFIIASESEKNIESVREYILDAYALDMLYADVKLADLIPLDNEVIDKVKKVVIYDYDGLNHDQRRSQCRYDLTHYLWDWKDRVFCMCQGVKDAKLLLSELSFQRHMTGAILCFDDPSRLRELYATCKEHYKWYDFYIYGYDHYIVSDVDPNKLSRLMESDKHENRQS